ncbi:MAG: heparinase II/III family protein [Hyphomicrobium sp.]
MDIRSIYEEAAALVNRLGLAEKSRMAIIAAKRSQRSTMTRVQFSPLMRWRFNPTRFRNLVIAPQDLRPRDSSFWKELCNGHIGLAGSVLSIGEKSPLDISPPSEMWARSFYGFDWLRHLEASGDPKACQYARAITLDWINRFPPDSDLAWEPAVIARRVISWISHAHFLLDGAKVETYEAITSSLSKQLMLLSGCWKDGPDGYPRLLSLIALVLADLCVEGHEIHLRKVESAFASEIAQQIFEDGSHISRNPSVLLEILLDLLPVRQCFVARGRNPPLELSQSIGRMISFLKFMKLGDGKISRFNGHSTVCLASLATVLAYDEHPGIVAISAAQSGYVRLARGATVIVADSGKSPPLEFSSEASAGCLSFEMSVGKHLLFVNGGCAAQMEPKWRSLARSTANHNSLCLAETSSAKLLRNSRFEALIGGVPITGPHHVHTKIEDLNGDIVWKAFHDGYEPRFGYIHVREMSVSASGACISGLDRLIASPENPPTTFNLAFAIHFHLHPEVKCRLGSKSLSAEILLPEGQVWLFTVEGASLSVEDSLYLAESSGPRKSLQFVLRGLSEEKTDVRWKIEAKL